MPEKLNILSKHMQLVNKGREYRIKLIPKFLFYPATLGEGNSRFLIMASNKDSFVRESTLRKDLRHHRVPQAAPYPLQTQHTAQVLLPNAERGPSRPCLGAPTKRGREEHPSPSRRP